MGTARRGFFLFAAVLCMSVPPSAVFAGSGGGDAGIEMSVEAEKKISGRLGVGLGAEYRLVDNMSSFGRFTAGPGAEYRITGWLKASAGFVFMYVRNGGKESYRDGGSLKWVRRAENSPRYRFYAALTGSYSVSRFKLSLRERYQYTRRPRYTAVRDYYTKYGDYDYSEDDVRPGVSRHMLRQRLTLSYDIRHCPLSPFVYAELYSNLGDGFSTEKWRYSAGLDWKVTKRNSVSLSWLYEDVRERDDAAGGGTHLICAGYTYKF